MLEMSTRILKLFYCYAREDKELRDELDMHLSALKRQNHIVTWYDRQIAPGMEWENEIDTHLNASDIILLLITPHFMASDYCYGIEMKRALEKHDAGTAYVIPIILRPVDWEGTPFSRLQVLPSDAKPVTLWQNRDQAYLDIAKGIRTTVKKLLARQDADEAQILIGLSHYKEALVACERAIQIDPNLSNAYASKGQALTALTRYEEALVACDRAIQIDPNLSSEYVNKGKALTALTRYKEALTAYSLAIHFDSNNAYLYEKRGEIFLSLTRYTEALTAQRKATQLDANLAVAWYNRGLASIMLGHFQEAASAYICAFQLDANLIITHILEDGLFQLLQVNYYEEIVATISQTIIYIVDQNIQLAPTFMLVSLFKAARHFLLGSSDTAWAVLEQAIEPVPDSVFAYFVKAMVLYARDREDEGEVVLD